MKKISRITIPNILVISAIIMIYFAVYWHYWLIKLLGNYVINTLLPIMILFFAFYSKECVSPEITGRLKKRIFYLLFPLTLYILLASISTVIHEEGFDNTKRLYIYIYSPVLIFVSLYWMHTFRKNENIRTILHILCLAGLIFSIYVAYIHLDPDAIKNLPVLETNRGPFMDITEGYGVGKYGVNRRYTVPGISPIEYGPLIVPLIFVSIYFAKNSADKMRYFYFCTVLFLSFCALMTVSRGAFLGLIAGIVYLLWNKWFSFKEKLILFSLGAIAVSSFATILIIRLIITFAFFSPMDVSFIDPTAPQLVSDPRYVDYGETFSQITQHPFLGMGMTNFKTLMGYGKQHSNYLIVPLGFGVPAGFFYILFITLLFIMIQKRVKKLGSNKSARELGLVLGAGVVSFMVHLLGAPTDLHYIWVWFGLAGAWLRNCENEQLGKRVTQIG